MQKGNKFFRVFEMNDIYQRIRLAGEKKDCEQILGVINAIKSGRLKNDIQLLNYFREVPVSYPATIETVENDFAEFLVNPIQAVVISFEKVTVLKSSHFLRDVIAYVNYVNVEKSRIVLSSFSYALVRADRRMSVRVELNELLYATFSHQNGKVQGKLLDMSLTGVSILVAADPGIPLSEQGKLAVHLPTDTIDVTATLLKVVHAPEGCRLVFEMESTRAAEMSISQYIFRRQLEIIKELKEHPSIP